MKLSIVIVSWNTVALLERCLASIYASPPAGSFEVLVVDNASLDGTPQRVREAFPAVHLIENHENVGFARANNQAIRSSRGRYVLLLNPDTLIRAGALTALLRFLDSRPTVGGAGARLLNPDGSLQHSCSRIPTLPRELWRLFHLDGRHRYAMEGWGSVEPRQVEVLLGACLMVRREALEQVGLLDESYFIYSEEVDLCYRLQQAGWPLYWVPTAEVVHYGGQSTQQVATEMFLQLYRAKLHYFRKHGGRLAGRCYKLILLAASLVRLALSPAAWLERPERRRHHLQLAGHYWRLLKRLPTL